MKQPKVRKSFNPLRKGHVIYFPEDSELTNSGFLEFVDLVYKKKVNVKNPHRLIVELTHITDQINEIKQKEEAKKEKKN